MEEAHADTKNRTLCEFLFPKTSDRFVLRVHLIQMRLVQLQVLRNLPKILAAGRCKKSLMNEQKRSELYSVGKSLNEKSGRQALGGGQGRERETDAG